MLRKLRLASALPLVVLVVAANASIAAPRPDIVFADFESPTYPHGWLVEGTAFGPGPAAGTLPNQMAVTGFSGNRLVNTYFDGDRTIGTLTSPSFKIDRKYITFLIGGGGHERETFVELLVDDKPVRTASGSNTRSGGSEALEPGGWDVADLAGKNARLRIVDRATGGWGHINLDHVVFTDTKPAAGILLANPSRAIAAKHKWLNLGVKNGGKVRTVKVIAAGKPVREFTIEAADAAPDWWATLDVSAWAGAELTVEADRLPESSQFLAQLETSDAPKGRENLYREPLRPQFHFSPSRGWLNDPNGLVFYNGEYHLFYQHNPYGREWGNMHWGHAVSKDLIRWREQGIALYPDSFGTMFSGSGVVDWQNTSGLGVPGKPPVILAYTAAGQDIQGIASSTDGRTFTKLPDPVVKKITSGNRDPKIFWHEPTKRWVMTLYVELDRRHTIHIFTSTDLKEWKLESHVDGFFECPDLFPLAVDGDANNVKWLMLGASSEYKLGGFDGRTFTPETPLLKGHLGRGFYAAQSFSDIPAADGRRILIGWFQAPSPGMPFNQAMSVPLDLKLLTTPAGPRLSMTPVKELKTLRTATKTLEAFDLKPGDANPLDGTQVEIADIRIEFDPATAETVNLDVRGVSIVYDAKKQELIVNNDHRAPAPLRNGKQRLTILADRTGYEIFASDGLCYVPFPVIPKPDATSLRITATGGTAKVTSLAVHTLGSMWDEKP